jgi:Fe-S cluster assembly iron-binding protein IscA
MLVKVTDEAKVKLEEILGQDKSDKALRIYVAAFG